MQFEKEGGIQEEAIVARTRQGERVEEEGILVAARMRIERIIRFLYRQKRNYRVAVVRSSANSFLMNLTKQYNSIYTVGLGASSVELGTVSSVGSAVSALISTPVGWLVDRFGIKLFYSLAVILMAIGALLYALAQDWRLIIVASILAAISMRFTGTSCSVICADSVENKDRVTAQNTCVTFASIASMLSPLLGAHLVTVFGGMDVEGIRPLYYIRFVGYGVIFLWVLLQLREPERRMLGQGGTVSRFLSDFRELFAGRDLLRRWILIAALTSLPMAVANPFFLLFAHEAKGAEQYVLGAMTTATTVARLLFGIPMGRLADSLGRKRIIYLLTPLWYGSFVVLVFSPNTITLIAAAVLQTFYRISSGVTSAMTLELVPLEQQGRWSGLLGLFRGLVTVPAPILGGLIWRELGPMYVFLLPLVLDLVVRIPLLATVPETLEGPNPADM